ncbi:unnamed protein product, partial [marine sediment metagenome]
PHNRIADEHSLVPCDECAQFTMDNRGVASWFLRITSFHLGPLTQEVVQQALGDYRWPEAVPNRDEHSMGRIYG